MQKLFLLAALSAAGACAQTTVTVTISIPNAMLPVIQDWVLSQCPSPLVAGACPNPAYPDVPTLIKGKIAEALQARVQAILAWAISTNDPNLPAPLQTALANQATNAAALASAQAAANPTVQ